LRKLLKIYSLPLLLLLIVLVFGMLNPLFLTPSNLINILDQNSIIGIVSMGMTLVIIIGGIDLSVGSIFALCGIFFASLLTNEVSITLAIIATLLLGIALGFINGYLIRRWNIPAFIVTLGVMSTARGGALLLSSSKSISIASTGYGNIMNYEILGISTPIIVFIVISLLLGFLLENTFWGKFAYAIGGNEKAAAFNGINVDKLSILAYVVCGLTCAVASLLLVGKLNSAQPQAGQLYELSAIAAVVIGGASLAGGEGSIKGTFIGVLILGVIQNGFSILNVPSYFQYILVGIIIIASVLIDKKLNLN